MSRIGKAPINIPSGVTVTVDGTMVTVKGSKGELKHEIPHGFTLDVEDGSMEIKRPTDQKRHKALHGLHRSLIANMIIGVNEGIVKELELIGVGYRVSNTGNLLELSVGYSHPIMFYIPDDLSLETKMEKGKSPYIRIEGIDAQLVGQVAAKIRAFRKPEPYKGKGIKYLGEIIRRKAGKTAGA